jgi:aspartate kinase
MIVLKFGGTSAGTPERIRKIAELVHGMPGVKFVILSAMSGTTNSLTGIAESLHRKNTSEAQSRIQALEEKYRCVVDALYTTPEFRHKGHEMIDSHFAYIRSFSQDLFTVNEVRCILAQGELISSALFWYHCQEAGIRSVLVPALNFMRIDRESEPDEFYIRENLHRELAAYPEETLLITQGYICRNAFGEIDNLGRGGSDFTASLIGRAAHAEEIQIWTDIDGFHDNDPRFVTGTHAIPELSFDEAAELAYFGAKILHPSTILPARVAGIPVVIKNTLNTTAPGTRIMNRSAGKGPKAVAAKDGITAIRVRSGRMLLAYGFLRKVFEIFEIYKTPIDVITTSEVSVSLTIDDTRNLDQIILDLQHYGTVETDTGQTLVCIVGEGIAGDTQAASTILAALAGIPVRMISYGGSESNISLLVPASYKKQALNALSAHLFNS